MIVTLSTESIGLAFCVEQVEFLNDQGFDCQQYLGRKLDNSCLTMLLIKPSSVVKPNGATDSSSAKQQLAEILDAYDWTHLE